LNFSLVLICFVGSKANVFHGVAKEGLTWEKDGHRFICKVETCNTSYSAKYLLVKHLQWKHDISTKLGKPRHLSTRQEGSCRQEHASMNAWVLNNPFFRFRRNEHKAIAWAKVHATCKWDQLQNDALQIKLALKPTLVRLVFFMLIVLLGIHTWGVGFMPPNMMTKLKKNNNLAYLIWANKVSYAKGFKDAWDN
jgi:hypothetical protein